MFVCSPNGNLPKAGVRLNLNSAQYLIHPVTLDSDSQKLNPSIKKVGIQ